MVAQALLQQYLYTNQQELLTAPHTAPAGATTTIIAASAAGMCIVVVTGHVTAHTAGTGQWFHTAAGGGNEMSGISTLAAGNDFELGPWVLPAATLLCCQAVTSNIRGTICWFLAPE